MRITGGILTGRRVEVPPGQIRPAMDRMRESVFAALGDLAGRSFLDLFSGSGVVALEAASRGAADIEAVEADKGKAKTLFSNIKISPVSVRCRFMAVELYIKRAKRAFDVVFCDPPFPYRYKSGLIVAITLSKLFSEKTMLIIHRPKSESFEFLSESANLLIENTRQYGNSMVDFIRKRI